MQQRHDQAGTGGADGMPERAGTAIDVEFFPGNPEIALRRHRHHRKRLVDLEQIDITNAPADRSEEHTSELQSQSNLVCRLLLAKTKNVRQLVAHRTRLDDFDI